MLNINQLSASDIEQAEALLVELIQSQIPSADLTRGRVLRDLLIRPAAMFYAYNDANMAQLRNSMSLKQIAQDPTIASDEIVDGVLSNLLITRDTGANASGQLRIIISSKIVTTVDSSAAFFTNGLEYRPTQAFVGVVSQGNVVNSSSRLITQRSDGAYEFIIDVAAVAPGTEYNVSNGTRFTTTSFIPRLIDIAAASDFSGGRGYEDNETLVAKVQNGISARILSGRAHIEALLKQQFPQLVNVSVIGYGDPEMRRDAHNMFNISQGGKVDIYVRTSAPPTQEILDVTSTMFDAESKTLVFSLDIDKTAGVYDAVAIYRENETPYAFNSEDTPTLVDSLEITEKNWSFYNEASSEDFVPEITSLQEAAFSRYRTLQVKFIDPTSDLVNNETATYKVYLLKMPSVAEIQDYVNRRDVRSPGADYLVKAAIPALCYIGVSVIARDVNNVDTAAIKNAIANRVNAMGFDIGKLPASVIIDAAQGQLSSSEIIDLPISMLVKLHKPDGNVITITGVDEIEIPEIDDDETVSTRTVAFLVRPEDIDVTVKRTQAREV